MDEINNTSINESEEVYLQVNCIDTCCSFYTGTGPTPGTTESLEYNYCGRDCGDGRQYGGGAIVNSTDLCCYFHDECLNRGEDRCKCHNELMDCTADKDDLGVGVIRFGIWADTRC
ncbi:hypothetical protein [Salimicrobium jeotgali]|uniref:hypothetical protein n=1 Tax=Salimicrobium jeotgali TaxID=1230341 RepID=UPI0012E18BE5|nr:hypothetical protein [Salimicrobium jeotgali]MBM7697209.1 hypothetical protein [Salimicrobium jeotgali]